MAQNIVSGTVRVTNTSTVITRTFSAAVTVSNWNVQDYTITNGLSDFIVSLPNVSNPGFLLMMATSTVRVNFGGHASADSAASLGFEFKDLYARVGSGISGDINLHFSNSSGDSAVVTVIQGL
jgi:hypothetical protein